MLKKLLILLLVVSCSSAIFAQKDYSEKWNAAYNLFRTRKYAEAMDAFAKLAENTSNPGNQYNCYIHAGYSARAIKKYDEAIAFAEKAEKIVNPYQYSSMIRKIDFMYSAGKYKEITEKFPAETIMKWPECYRSDALYYLGLAQYNLKQGEDAEKTFTLMFENAQSPNHEALALLRHGYNYRHRIKDDDKALEAYNKIIKTEGAHPNYQAEAYLCLTSILISQKKNDEAIAEYDKLLASKKVSAYWKSRGLYDKGNLLKTMDKKEEAIKCYKDAIATKGCPDWVKNGCEKQLKALEPKPEKTE
ncbi:MAG: tetratricopeptide repeat protein [Victivallaceae bacterium]|nr:tetratricopeptide repeat protein [Victivallaceae bacterium]